MRKVVIIDDEPIVREGLRNIISWSDYGYYICDVGVDGRDGLNKIRLQDPDLVLIDIRMPGFSGIEIIQQIKEEGYKCKFIILSGYSSFSYAKESIKLGIGSYLLKPIDEEELISSIVKVSEELKQEENINNQLTLFKRINEEQSLKKLLEGRAHEIDESLLEEWTDELFQVVSLFKEINQPGYQWLTNELTDHEDAIKLIRKDARIHLLFINQEEKVIKDYIQFLITNLEKYGNEGCTVLLGNPVTGSVQIVDSFRQTQKLKDVYFCHSQESFLSYEMLEEKTQGKSLETIKNNLCRFMEFNDFKNITNELKQVEKYYQFSYFSQDRVKAEIIDFTASIFEYLQKHHSSVVFTPKEVLVDKILKQPTLQDLLQYIQKELEAVSQNINKNTSNRSTVQKMKDYVDQYFYEDLNLKLLAELFNYNSSYLGKKFKKQTGEYFHTYLDRVRIEKAKVALSKGDDKVYQISERVGYCNIDYFHKKFKKYVGISPKEYQKGCNDKRVKTE
ncbi:response regulator transcription factor [Aquibacillus kalidii]|uniref:response regulator transcription factor n=1 Tax=Aquibacillus kalidii TaxID=2762597 RepID=UPI001648978D|nr:response regulator [Aquibacillus kalidii]